jgi:excisionase family DNA binding protein
MTAMKAADLAKLLREDVLDLQGAAEYLGLEKNSVEYAVYRGRLTAVQFANKKLFTKSDLRQYKMLRGRGKASQLEDVRIIVV